VQTKRGTKSIRGENREFTNGDRKRKSGKSVWPQGGKREDIPKGEQCGRSGENLRVLGRGKGGGNALKRPVGKS